MLEVSTGSRLHFGLLELALGESNRFGGLGLMLDAPGWKLVFQYGKSAQETAEMTVSSPEIAARIAQVQDKLVAHYPAARSIRVTVERELPLHSGLGAGTQLAAATAFGLKHYLACESANIRDTSGTVEASALSLDELILLSGRGKRSGIGLAGFQRGGLILDEGYPAKLPDESNVRPLVAGSCCVNPEWRVVLIAPKNTPVITGGYETSLMECAGEKPNPNKHLMLRLAQESQAICQSSDGFEGFVTTLEKYLQHAAELFMVCQGGVYNGVAVREAAESAIAVGLRGVGQSSWGPTIFGFAPNESRAHEIVSELQSLTTSKQCEVRIATPATSGGIWKWSPRE